ncbi:MAG: hypothetical protein CMJ94_15035 [Planctomycetes bacterium]|nr:hypothetical protein [Planctomycetota bacterium]
MLRASLAACLLLLSACGSVPQRSTQGSLDQLAAWMTGTFSSASQAAADPAHFFDIRLIMVPIWEDLAQGDERWLYVEQAAADELDRPYRQRIYRLSQIGPNRYQSEVFELPNDPLRYAGAWRTPAIFTTFGPTELTKREGCAIRLTAGEDVYIGRTEERSCPSTLRGASWATSEVILQEQQLTSWDRGWDDAGNQVWGATEQGYRFEKLASVALEDFEDDV